MKEGKKEGRMQIALRNAFCLIWQGAILHRIHKHQADFLFPSWNKKNSYVNFKLKISFNSSNSW